MEENVQDASSTSQNEIACNSCGAKLNYAPGTSMLLCEYCGAENKIETEEVEVQESSYLDAIHAFESDENNLVEEVLVDCNSCGAQTTFEANLVSYECEFCGSPIVMKEGHPEKVLKPEYMLPFKIVQKEAFHAFSQWIKTRWFAPNDLKAYASRAEKLSGIYLPYWTFDSHTNSTYVGQRGTTHTRKDKDGKTTTYTTWSTVSGRVVHFFDDLMIVASKSLPRAKMDALEPWDLENLEAYNDKYLTGFKAEHYSIGLEPGFEEAKTKMDVEIRSMVRSQIGGDQQRINSLFTSHNDIKFKHILLPVWISAFRYKQKTYQIMVNARTGEVQGERPYSWIKITLFILSILIIIATVYYFYNNHQSSDVNSHSY